MCGVTEAPPNERRPRYNELGASPLSLSLACETLTVHRLGRSQSPTRRRHSTIADTLVNSARGGDKRTTGTTAIDYTSSTSYKPVRPD